MQIFELPPFDHINAETVEKAVSLLQKHGEEAKVVAGGTDLFGLMKDRLEGPELKIPKVLVNIKNIPEMTRITDDDETGLRIGAAVTLNRLETSDVIQQRFSLLSQAARQVGTTQIRHMGTIGGNICQRPRCMYFRHPYFICFKKGGTVCYAATGEHRDYHAIMKIGKCAMAHPSDMAPALAALGARAIIAGFEGEKEIPLQDFFLDSKQVRDTVLNPHELLTGVRVPGQKGWTNQLFLKHRIRHASDFALSSVATVVRIRDGICEDIRMVLGGIASFPYRASKVEELMRGKRWNRVLISQAAEGSIDGATPLPMNLYKKDLVKALVRQALTSIWNEAGDI